MGSATTAYEVESTIAGHGRELFVVKRAGHAGRYIMATFELRAEDRDAVESEVARCVEISHRGVVPVVDMFEQDGQLVLVFEKVEGITLQRLFEHIDQSDEPLADAAIYHLAHRLFTALDAAHTARDADDRVVPLVHAELGPHQLFISWEGDVQLLGVGLSTMFRLAAASQLDAPAAVPFVPPEILMGGALTVRGNVYSAAAMVWALLARQLPPTDGTAAPRLVDVRPDVDPAVLRALDEALAASLLKRRITAGALAALFEPLSQGGGAALSWSIDVLRAIETFDESLFGFDSLPAPKLSDAPPESMPAVISIPPSDDEGFASLPPPSSEAIPISVIPPSSEAIPISIDVVSDPAPLPPRRPPPKPTGAPRKPLGWKAGGKQDD